MPSPPEHTQQPTGQLLHFAVRDTGIGIPPEKQALVFEAFEQADSSTRRKFGGTGLGLAISTRLVNLMGGRIWLESEVGQGSAFHFTARFEVPAEQVVGPSSQPATSVRGMRVLVVDDNATSRDILAEILRSWEARPDSHASVAEALQAVAQARAAGDPYRLLLIDAGMPERDGFCLAAELKGQDGSVGPIIMMLTAGERRGEIDRCEAAGIAAYLMKPVKQSELFDAIMLAMGVTTPEESEASTRAARRVTRALNILLAEDSLVNQKLALGLLGKHGHHITIANNGREAIELAETKTFDLILMDVQMPEMDGLEATKIIRQREQRAGTHTPIVAMTAHAMTGDREICLAAGMDGYVSKPIRVASLFETIQSLVSPGARESGDGAGRVTAGTESPTTSRAAPGSGGNGEPQPAADSSSNVLSDDFAAGSDDTVILAGVPSGAGSERFNWSTALEAVQGDSGLLKEIVEIFLEECPRMLDEIRRSMKNNDAPTLRRAAHTLKGSLRYFGVDQASRHANRLEELGQSGDLGEARQVFPLLEDEITRLMPPLTDFANSGELAPNAPI